MAAERDWAGYNAALERRGSLTLFVDEDTLAGWLNVERPGRPGAPFTYSDAAYRACYQLQIVYGLPLRQTRGLVGSLLGLLGARLRVPSVASLSERRASVNAEPLAAPVAGGALTLLLDSTGFKTVGEGEWRGHKWPRQAGGEPRKWRKLHVGVDHATGVIVSYAVTDSSVGDVTAAPGLIVDAAASHGLAEVVADGAYDARKLYELICDDLGARATIRLPWNAARGLHPARDESFRVLNWHGAAEWRRRNAYGRRSLVETTMSRLKRLRPCLSSRGDANQAAELAALIGVANHFIAGAAAA